MARKAKSSLIEDIFEITASLPWWAGTFLAILSNVILHRYAIADDVSNIAGSGQISHLVISNVIKTLASFGQYILPALFLLAAFTSFIKQKKRKKIVINGGSAMTRRIAKRGSNKGNEFWGCMSFPKCRGVRS